MIGAVLAGALVGAVFAAFVVGLRTDQVIAGTAISMLALGLTGTLYRALYGAAGAALTIPTMHPLEIPVLSAMPLVGHALFAQPAPTYALYALIPATWWWMFRTHAGSRSVRAVKSPTPFAVRACRWDALSSVRCYSRARWPELAVACSLLRRRARSPKGCPQDVALSPSPSWYWVAGIRCALQGRHCCSDRQAHCRRCSRQWDRPFRISYFLPFRTCSRCLRSRESVGEIVRPLRSAESTNADARLVVR